MSLNMKLFLCSSLLLLIVAAELASAENPSSFFGRLLDEAGDGNGDGNANSKNVQCKHYPQICLKYGKFCCGNKCVDLHSDNRNCGRCYNKCRFPTRCCNGVCSNLSSDKNNCGRCGHRCADGSRCVYGMCSYA